MRWLAILAILVAGASAYLLWSMSSGTTAHRAHAGQLVEVERENESSGIATSVPKKVPPVGAPAKQDPTPAKPQGSVEPEVGDPDATAKEVPWTDGERWQKLWTASGRYEKGNYPGAIELAMEIARRHPPWQEDAWKVAIQAHCAMNEPDKANALSKKMTDANAIEDITKSCAAWGVKLTR